VNCTYIRMHGATIKNRFIQIYVILTNIFLKKMYVSFFRDQCMTALFPNLFFHI